jgi:hypothetical protein
LSFGPYAKQNFVDHTVTDQSSILRFIEDNWQTVRIDDFSFDSKAGPLLNMFAFPRRSRSQEEQALPRSGQRRKVRQLADCSGRPVKRSPGRGARAPHFDELVNGL